MAAAAKAEEPIIAEPKFPWLIVQDDARYRYAILLMVRDPCGIQLEASPPHTGAAFWPVRLAIGDRAYIFSYSTMERAYKAMDMIAAGMTKLSAVPPIKKLKADREEDDDMECESTASTSAEDE